MKFIKNKIFILILLLLSANLQYAADYNSVYLNGTGTVLTNTGTRSVSNFLNDGIWGLKTLKVEWFREYDKISLGTGIKYFNSNRKLIVPNNTPIELTGGNLISPHGASSHGGTSFLQVGDVRFATNTCLSYGCGQVYFQDYSKRIMYFTNWYGISYFGGGLPYIENYSEILDNNYKAVFWGDTKVGGTVYADQVRVNNDCDLQGDDNFTVSGYTVCTGLTVKEEWQWPDYVFDDGYELMPIHKVKEYVAENKHLPNVPDAATVASEGLNLGEMQNIQMEKIEELTLYIIQQRKQIETLKALAKNKK